jgi:membrane protease subunit (stomatin/prohibitin family)
VYFCSTRKFTNLKWGTPGPATMRDKDFGIVRATAFGIYAIRIKDPGTFIKDVVGTDGHFTTEGIQENLRGKLGTRIKEVMPELGLSIIDLEAKVIEMGSRLQQQLAPEFEAYGLELVEVQVQDVGLPEEVEKAIDKRGAMAAIGNLQAYTQYETAGAIRDAANNPGGVAGAGVGIGAGVAMGAQMVNAMGLSGAGMANAGGAAAQGASGPPPVPGAVGFHIAVNGQQTGPFDLSALQGQASSGQIKRDTLVWKTGMAQWVKAGDVPELLALFADVPPPVPPSA